MTRLATPFVTDDDLIIVEALVTGPRGTLSGRFVVDTGAAVTTMTHELAESLGYTPRDGFRRTKVHTAIGAEEGYVLRVSEFTVLGFTLTSFPINVFDLGHDDIDGLLGMNFLSDFNYEVRSSEHRILVEKDRPMTA
jgi:clan AA aspartic protease (TIGR02281 family)